jgi:hypothetical protein
MHRVAVLCILFGAASASAPDGFDAHTAYREPLGFYPKWEPNTQAWSDYMDRRMAQIARVKDSQQRWDGYLVAMQQGMQVKNYTERGWAVVECPPEVYQKLYKAFHRKFDSGARSYEGTVDQIHCEKPDGDTNSPCAGSRRSWFVNTGLNDEVLADLKPIHEEWSQVDLIPSIAYGLRVYQNGSSLTMHVDRVETHVVSSILHVDRDYGGQEPWPIVIEGVDGNIAEVDLKPGQMLLYESAKCTHGRPRTFRGNWYTSLFIHYRPEKYALRPHKDRIAEVPESWRDALPPLPGLPELTVYGTGFKEHGCPGGWCALAAQWPPAGYAPAPEAEPPGSSGPAQGLSHAHVEL